MTDAELDDRLADLLTGYEVLAPPLLERAHVFHTADGASLAGALHELHLVPDDTLHTLLEEITGVRAVDPSLITVYPNFVERMNLLIPPDVVASLLIFPAQVEINTIHVCMRNPTDTRMLRALEALSGCRVRPLASLQPRIVAAIGRHYGAHVRELPRSPLAGWEDVVHATYQRLLDAPFDTYLKPAVAHINRQRDAIARDPNALAAIIREPRIIRLVQQIVSRAIESRASDIHVEPIGDALRVRKRIDGAMQTAHVLPAAATAPLVARLKAMADLAVGAGTAPLDGQISYELVWGRSIDLRLSLVPSVTGEKIVLRVLDRTRERRQLTDLGVDERSLAMIEEAAGLPNGMLLVTGPTGSGKSSTLYALLDRLNDDDTCILTAEDPVESRIAGVTQVHCEEGSTVTFASALRSFLRQDPDVLMVGEIRDAETADIALKAALTGHLVLSTLHTNDAPGTVLRLINMELEPFLVASALRLVVAQRLIRRLCTTCRAAVPPGSEPAVRIVEALGATSRDVLRTATIYEPVGCPDCAGSGYRGRIGIFEVLRVTEPIEELIVGRATAAAIRAQARREGMRTLRDAAVLKVAAGETSIAEVLQHTVADMDDAATVPSKGTTTHV